MTFVVQPTIRLAMLAVAAWASVSCAASAGPAHPMIGYWHLWVDGKGESHLAHCSIGGFRLEALHKPAPPQWEAPQHGTATVTFEAQPDGYHGGWHEDPKVQWVAPLSGRWAVQAQDGRRVVLGPADLLLGEDQHTKADAQGHRGHLSLGENGQPVSLLIVSTDRKPTVDEPCHPD